MKKNNKSNINVTAICKKILGIEPTASMKSLTHAQRKDLWNVQHCFKRTSALDGRVGNRYSFHYGKGMDLIAKYFESK